MEEADNVYISKAVTVLISTCDKYEIAWDPFWYSFKKYWPDCPWTVRFITNSLESPCGVPIKVGSNTNWTVMHKLATSQLTTEVFLLLLEDFWLTHPVDTASILEFADIVLRGDADKVGLRAGSHTCKGTYVKDTRLEVLDDTSVYRTALQAGLWRVSTFQSLLRGTETPWDFETEGNLRSQNQSMLDRFLNVKEPSYIHYISAPGALRRRKWTQAAIDYAAKEGLKIDFSKRPG